MESTSFCIVFTNLGMSIRLSGHNQIVQIVAVSTFITFANFGTDFSRDIDFGVGQNKMFSLKGHSHEI